MTHPNAPSTERLRSKLSQQLRNLAEGTETGRVTLTKVGGKILRDAAISLDALTQENARLREALRDMIEAFQPFTSKPMGAPGSSARREQETQVRVHAAARRALNGGTSDAE